MPPVVNQFLVEEATASTLFSDKPQPNIVGCYAGRERQGIVKHFATKSHTASAIGVSPKCLPITSGRMMKGEKILSHRDSILIDQFGIMVEHPVFLKDLQTAFHLVGMPYIILIREEDIVALGMRNGILKIMYIAMVRIGEHLNTWLVHGSHHLQGGIRRAIVGDNNLVLGTELRKDGFELFLNIYSTIVGGHTD